ncbi:MAG TPA: hypothetical protein VK859_07105 [bacterium]|jgi:hypothetical protein|nr:hypothetical protein [bacterium]
MSLSNLKSLLRLVIVKLVGGLLAVIFIFVALFFLAYPLISLVASQGGQDAKVAAVFNHIGKLKTGCRIGGLFEITVDNQSLPAQKKKKGETNPKSAENKIYCLYPAWPDQLEPQSGDIVRVWPAKKPLFAEPLTDGWGWFILGTIFVVGLVLVEFAFLALTVA